MINILALSLVLGLLAAAGIWSLTPQRERVRLKEGHTIIVVDHDEDGKPKDKVSYPADEAKDKISETVHGVKDKVLETAHEAKRQGRRNNPASEGGCRWCFSVRMAKDMAEMARCHILNNCTEKMKMARENAEEAKEAREKTVIKGKSSANKLFDGVKYVSTMEALNPVMGIANLVGLASAYGVAVWVTIGMALLGYILRQSKTVLSSKHRMLQDFNLLSSFLMVLVNALYFKPKASKRIKIEKEEGRGRERDHNFIVEESRGREAATKSRETHPASAANIAEEQVMKLWMARLNERLKKLNTKSSLLNVVTLMALTWHLIYLTHHLSFNSFC
ncbi:hypothetical protein Goari_009825 [Gossypium aridum]|uniref:DUF4149 domain-containing protein n=2 Tax=Gossypium TaxID=3633 RepID=A0A7J8XY48_GOSAI|nr:hypothetical protein [Gossypium aridum]